MAISPEHQFIAEEINKILLKYSNTKLLGVLESERKKFDYSCILERNFQKVLTSQVLWSNTRGIRKDLMSLVSDDESSLKAYFVQDTTKHRLQIAEVLSELKRFPQSEKFLNGLKIIYLPSGFDADRENEQDQISKLMSNYIYNDLLFNTIFGRLTSFDIKVFALHGGPFGLKYTILDEISKNGLINKPTFKNNINYSTTGTIDKVTTMLISLGLVKQYKHSVILLPTIKGYLLLDYIKRLLFEETISNYELNEVSKFLLPKDNDIINYKNELVNSAKYAIENYDREIFEKKLEFYKVFNLNDWADQIKLMPEIEPELINEFELNNFI